MIALQPSAATRIEDIPRIAFVTQRFFELQGLIPAAMGAAWLFAALMHHAIGSPAQSHGTFQVFLFGMLAAGPATAALQKMYRRTFGEVVATTGQKLTASLQALLIYAGVSIDIFGQLGGGRPGPSLAAVALASYSTWIVLRDWRWRLHHLIAVAAGLGAAIVSASVPPAASQFGVDPARAEAFLLACTLMGLGMVITGLLDHQLLASSLRPRAAVDGSSPARARVCRRYPLTRAWIAGVICAAAGITLRFSDQMLALVLPMSLMLSLMPLYIVPALLQSRRALRDIGKRIVAPDAGPTVNISTGAVVLMLLIAVAAAVESALFSRASPALLAATLGFASVWVAVRDWGGRKHYVIGGLAAAVVLALIPRVQPARGFAILVFAAAGAITVQALLDHRKAEHDESI